MHAAVQREKKKWMDGSKNNRISILISDNAASHDLLALDFFIAGGYFILSFFRWACFRLLIVGKTLALDYEFQRFPFFVSREKR